ncbi:MAG: extracellular solute-binding protein, partial [Devosia sp.]
MRTSKTWRSGALVGALALVAALGSVPTAQAAELQLWRFFNECAAKFPADVVTIDPNNADVCAVQQILANQFNAANPDLQVKTTSLLWPGIVELNSALSAGTPPDIVSLHAFRVPAYASKGALADLTPYLAEAGIDPNDILAKPREAVTFNGKIYAIPIDVHGALWHINLDLWQKAGLVGADGKPMLPSSLSEFEAACQKIKAAGGGAILGGGDDDGISTGWVWASLYAQFGGKAFDDNGMPSVDTPAALTALQTMLKLRSDGCFSGGQLAKTYEDFLNGKVAGVVAGTWQVNEWDGQVRDPNAALKHYYVAPMPQIGSQPGTWGGSHTFVVPLGTNADPVRVKAALKYIKFFWDHDLDWTRTGHSTTSQSILDSAEYQALPHHAEYLAYADQAVYNPQTTWAAGYDAVLQDEIAAALLGTKTPEQALQDMQSRLT